MFVNNSEIYPWLPGFSLLWWESEIFYLDLQMSAEIRLIVCQIGARLGCYR